MARDSKEEGIQIERHSKGGPISSISIDNASPQAFREQLPTASSKYNVLQSFKAKNVDLTDFLKALSQNMKTSKVRFSKLTEFNLENATFKAEDLNTIISLNPSVGPYLSLTNCKINGSVKELEDLQRLLGQRLIASQTQKGIYSAKLIKIYKKPSSLPHQTAQFFGKRQDKEAVQTVSTKADWDTFNTKYENSKSLQVSVAFFNKEKIHDLARVSKTSEGFYSRVGDINIRNMPKQKKLSIGGFPNLRRLEATNANLTYFLQHPEEGSKRLTHIILKNTTVSGDSLLAVIRNSRGSLKMLDIDIETRNKLQFSTPAGKMEFDSYLTPVTVFPQRPSHSSSTTTPVFEEQGFDVLNNEPEMSSTSELIYPSVAIKNKLFPSVAQPHDLDHYLHVAGEIYKKETTKEYYIEPIQAGVSAELQGPNHEPLITVLEAHTHVCADLMSCPIDPKIKAHMILTAMGLTADNPHADFSEPLRFDPETQGDVLQAAIVALFSELKQLHADAQPDLTDNEENSVDLDSGGFGVKWVKK